MSDIFGEASKHNHGHLIFTCVFETKNLGGLLKLHSINLPVYSGTVIDPKEFPLDRISKALAEKEAYEYFKCCGYHTKSYRPETFVVLGSNYIQLVRWFSSDIEPCKEEERLLSKICHVNHPKMSFWSVEVEDAHWDYPTVLVECGGNHASLVEYLARIQRSILKDS